LACVEGSIVRGIPRPNEEPIKKGRFGNKVCNPIASYARQSGTPVSGVAGVARGQRTKPGFGMPRAFTTKHNKNSSILWIIQKHFLVSIVPCPSMGFAPALHPNCAIIPLLAGLFQNNPEYYGGSASPCKKGCLTHSVAFAEQTRQNPHFFRLFAPFIGHVHEGAYSFVLSRAARATLPAGCA
jgi:hypothetical protein